MHVAIISNQETQGGAAIATSRLAEGLCRAGCRVSRLVDTRDNREHMWETFQLTPALAKGRASRVARRLLPFPLPLRLDERLPEQALVRALERLRPDVVNVHNIHGGSRVGWSVNLLGLCAQNTSTVWTLHDMWSFTGRCLYNYDCRKFVTGCDAACPTADEYPSLWPKRIAWAYERRQRTLAVHPTLVAVAPSQWMAREAKAGLWSHHRVEVIPYGLPLSIYLPLDRAMARRALGIKTPGPVLLLSAISLTDKRKGGTLLRDALCSIRRRPLNVITLGSGRLDFNSEGINMYSLGLLDYDRFKVLAYNAADVLVHPALAENLSNVVMEAIACGTPVVAFRIGGMPDMIREGLTGWLVNEVSSKALAATLTTVFDELDGELDLRSSCRAVAEAEYNLELQAQRYLALFRSLGLSPDKQQCMPLF